MRRVFVASAGLLKVGDHWEKSVGDLAIEAGLKALGDRKAERIFVGNMFSAALKQEHLGALVANGLGLVGVPACKVEAACGSGGMAVSLGYLAVKSGEFGSVLVIGVEKMRDLMPSASSDALAMAESYEYTQFFGGTFVSLNALLTSYYMKETGASRRELASFPILAHKNAVTSEHAQFRREISYEDVERAPMVSTPLGLLECAPTGDGAASILLVDEETIAEFDPPYVELLSSEAAVNRFSLYQRDDMLDFYATRVAAERALDKAGIALKDVSFMEIHDAFPVVATLALESMGVSKRGEAAKDAMEGRFDLGGELPILTFGGLKARGHPVGATGVYQVAEAYLQLKGVAGKNQVRDAKFGLCQNTGGIDTTTIVSVLRRVEG